MIRWLGATTLIILMAAFGFGVYSYLGTLKTKAAEPAKAPTRTKPRFALPGTMILAQDGTLYELKGGTFTRLAGGNLTQAAVTPDHTRLVVVQRNFNYSDLYLLDLQGHVLRQMTQNASRVVNLNHWSFYPRVTPDGGSVFYSYDPKDVYNNFRVDLAIYSMPLAGPQREAVRWSNPVHYTGGDVQPIPFQGGVLFTRYTIDNSVEHSQLWFQVRPGSPGKALTDPAADCTSPALSPDGTKLAMICTRGRQEARLVVAPVVGAGAAVTLGPATDLVAGQLCASPVWAPDGGGLAYLAPAGTAGHYQLFYLQLPAPPTPTPSPTPTPRNARPTPTPIATPAPTPPLPRQLTTDNNFDATAVPVWF